MKKIGKKLLSLFVAAVMILTTLSVTAVSIGASCALPLPDYPAGAGYGNGCWNFANLVYNRYWGYSFTNSQNTTDNILYSNGVPINAASRQATASNLKKYIYDYKVPIGSVLRISTTLNYVSAANDGDLGHSMIITGYTSSNVTIYHVAGGKVLLQTLTYDYIATWMNINNGTQSIGNAYIKYTVTVDIVLENVPALKSLAVKDITYDSSKLELVGGAWKNVNGAVISDWNSADKNAVLAFSSNTDLNKAIFTLTFKVADDADDAAASVGCTLSARQKPENGTETEVEIAVIPGSIIISKTLRGDVNGDGYLDSDDAIYMLSHVLMPEMYSINQNGDFNKDGSIDSDDAIYLLYYVLMPDLYPLK